MRVSRLHTHKKHKKHKTQISDFHPYVFYAHKKHKKQKKYKKAQKAHQAQNTKQAAFFVLDAFYAHKNAAFFVFVRLDNFKLLCFFIRKFYTQRKAQKAHKKHKNANKLTSSSLPLRCF